MIVVSASAARCLRASCVALTDDTVVVDFVVVVVVVVVVEVVEGKAGGVVMGILSGVVMSATRIGFLIGLEVSDSIIPSGSLGIRDFQS